MLEFQCKVLVPESKIKEGNKNPELNFHRYMAEWKWMYSKRVLNVANCSTPKVFTSAKKKNNK